MPGSGSRPCRLQDSHNLLRPETVESLFVLAQVTGKAQYQEWGWHIFRAWEKFSRVDTGGYANLDSVLQVGVSPMRNLLPAHIPASVQHWYWLCSLYTGVCLTVLHRGLTRHCTLPSIMADRQHA